MRVGDCEWGSDRVGNVRMGEVREWGSERGRESGGSERGGVRE